MKEMHSEEMKAMKADLNKMKSALGEMLLPPWLFLTVAVKRKTIS